MEVNFIERWISLKLIESVRTCVNVKDWVCKTPTDNCRIVENTDEGTASCNACLEGHEVNQDNGVNHLKRCGICQAGKYEKIGAGGNGHSKCTYCEDAKYQAHAGKTSCNECIVGYVVNRVLCCAEWDHIRILGATECVSVQWARLKIDSETNELLLLNRDKILNTWSRNEEFNGGVTPAENLVSIASKYEWLELQVFKTVFLRRCDKCEEYFYRDQCGGPTRSFDFYVRYQGMIKTVHGWRMSYANEWTVWDVTETSEETASTVDFEELSILPSSSNVQYWACRSIFVLDMKQQLDIKEDWIKKETDNTHSYDDWLDKYDPGNKRLLYLAIQQFNDTLACLVTEAIEVTAADVKAQYTDTVELWEYKAIDMALALHGEIVSEGMCQSCKDCGDGIMTLDCAINFEGTCQQCRTLCNDREYWSIQRHMAVTLKSSMGSERTCRNRTMCVNNALSI